MARIIFNPAWVKKTMGVTFVRNVEAPKVPNESSSISNAREILNRDPTAKVFFVRFYHGSQHEVFLLQLWDQLGITDPLPLDADSDEKILSALQALTETPWFIITGCAYLTIGTRGDVEDWINYWGLQYQAFMD